MPMKKTPKNIRRNSSPDQATEDIPEGGWKQTILTLIIIAIILMAAYVAVTTLEATGVCLLLLVVSIMGALV